MDNNIQEQIERVQLNNVFSGEASYIGLTCRKEGLTRIVDFGSWVGVLAEEVFAQGVHVDSYHLVDCVPRYIELALERLEGQPVSSELVTLLPGDYTQDPPRTMRVFPDDTLNTSSIYSGFFMRPYQREHSVEIPIAPSQNLLEYIELNPERFGSDTYVKIDLDGVDISLAEAVLRQGLTPGAIQFEVWRSYRPGYQRILELAGALGYSTPQADLTQHNSFSVSLSKNYWWAVGYDIRDNQWCQTYYDKDHGARAV